MILLEKIKLGTKMKILSVHISVPKNNAEDWRISNIVQILKNNEHEVDLVHYCSKHAYEEMKNKEKYSKDKFIITSPLAVFFKHLKLLQEKEEYDLVYANTSTGTFCSVLGKLKKIPLVFDMHGSLAQELLLEKRSRLNPHFLTEYMQYKIMELTNLRISDEIICVSNKMMDYLHHKNGIALEKMCYATNGVDLEFFKPKKNESNGLKEKLGLEDKFIVGYIGGFQAWQGLDNLINSAESIEDKELAFIFVGGKKELNKKNIRFVPKINRSQVPDYYSICDVLVLPRPHHTATEIAAPTKFAEYTAMGKPVLTTNTGDTAELVRKYKCGIVVEDNNMKNLVRGIKELKNLDSNELKKMAKNSRKLAQNEFDWELVGVNLLNALEKFN